MTESHTHAKSNFKTIYYIDGTRLIKCVDCETCYYEILRKFTFCQRCKAIQNTPERVSQTIMELYL